MSSESSARRPYGIGLAIAFALLAPSTTKTAPEASLLGAADCSAGSADSCKPLTEWICIHGEHKDYNYCDPRASCDE